MDNWTRELEAVLIRSLKGRLSLMQSQQDKEAIVSSALDRLLAEPEGERFAAVFGGPTSKSSFIRSFLSYGILEDLLCHSDVEDIVINALKPIYVHHAKKGFIPTDRRFASRHELDIFVDKLVLFSGRTALRKIMNIELPNMGGRVNIVASPFGPQLTITKAKVEPMSIIDLIRRGTMTYEAAAQLWMYIDGMSVRPANVLIAGGPGTGKTTLLNALFSFIPDKDRMVLIEDTLELNTFLEDSCSRLETDEDMSLADLVKNSLRMRPERIVVGEVRGEEARDMITAVNVGKYCLGTIHALSAREAILRLQNEPMNVPEVLVNLVDVFVILKRHHADGRLFRVVDEISETGGMEQQKVLLGQVFKYDYAASRLKSVTPSTVFRDKLAESGVGQPRDVINEMLMRAVILKTLDSRDANTMKEVTSFCRAYQKDPHQAMVNIGLDRARLFKEINGS